MSGAVQVLTCQPSTDGGGSVAPCVDVAGVAYSPVLVPAHLLTDQEYQAFQAVSEPFNTSTASAYFSYGFAVPLLALVLGFGISSLMGALRSAISR